MALPSIVEPSEQVTAAVIELRSIVDDMAAGHLLDRSVLRRFSSFLESGGWDAVAAYEDALTRTAAAA